MSDFGKEVKKKLIDIGKTQNWLMDQVMQKTGLYLDSGYLYKILTGRRAAPKITAAIREILSMPESAPTGQKQDTTEYVQ